MRDQKSEIKILEEKLYFQIITESEKQTLDFLKRQDFEISKAKDPDADRAYWDYIRRIEIIAAQRFQKENPEINVTYDGVPISLFQ
jgi:hypothetical protein